MGMTATKDALEKLSIENHKAYNILKPLHEQAFGGTLTDLKIAQYLTDQDIASTYTPDTQGDIHFVVEQIKRIAASQ